jgi:hypothetical protein
MRALKTEALHDSDDATSLIEASSPSPSVPQVAKLQVKL